MAEMSAWEGIRISRRLPATLCLGRHYNILTTSYQSSPGKALQYLNGNLIKEQTVYLVFPKFSDRLYLEPKFSHSLSLGLKKAGQDTRPKVSQRNSILAP